MSNAINNRLAVITSYYAEVDGLIFTAKEVIDTYEGMIAQCNNGEGADHLFASLDKWEGELALLVADRAELDRMWNECLLSAEAA